MDREARAAEVLRSFYGISTAVVLGTGLGVMEREMDIHEAFPYAKIPGFPQSTVKGHAGRLLMGLLGGRQVLVMSGRFHLYEGYSAEDVTAPIRVFRMLGVKNLLISNAAGGLRKDLEPGSAMLITDHLNFTGRNPLAGPNREEYGPRFPDMTQPYSRRLADLARKRATEKSIGLREGVYVQVMGPSMETAAETRMLQRMGADAVGMSTVPEVIVARHGGMRVLGLSGISNKANLDGSTITTHEEVLEAGRVIVPRLKSVVLGVLANL